MMLNIDIPILGFAAYSGTGKTTLLIKIIPLLKRAGYQPGVIKHAHHSFEIDKPGKDSYEIRQAGVEQMFIGSKKRWALIMEEPEENHEIRLQSYISHMLLDRLDIILVEGFKSNAINKIEIHRPELGHPLLAHTDESIVAIASDQLLTNASLPTKVPVLLDLNNYQQIVQYIIEQHIQKHLHN